MNEHQLNTFIRVAELGSFSKAAAESYITAPALTQQVNLLESDLGFKLFNRGPSGVRLTAAGENFLQTARAIVGTMRSSRDIGSAIERGEHKVLTVGLEDSEVPDFVLPICEDCKSEHPGLEVAFLTTPTDKQLEALLDGKTDLFIAPDYYPCEGKADFVALYRDPYMCCVASGHRLASSALVKPADLKGERVFMEAFEYAGDLPLSALLPYVGRGDIDGTPFSVALPPTVALTGGVLPRLKKCSTHCAPLVSVPLDVEKGTVGLFVSREPSEPARWFVDAAKRHFGLDDTPQPRV